MKRYKKYKQNVRSTRRQLKKLVKTWHPFDYHFIMQSIKVSLLGMKKYYEEGENVHSLEDKDVPEFNVPLQPTRLEVINTLLAYWEAYDNSPTWVEELENWNKFWDYMKTWLGSLWD